MSSPLARFNQIPRRLRNRMGSDFVASLVVTLTAGMAFTVVMAILILAIP